MAELVKLQQEFPDMSQSVLGDILSTYSNDSRKAIQALRGLNEQESAENEKRIKELEDMFKNLSREFIVDSLKQANWNVDAAILPLFNKSDEKIQEEKRRIETERRKKREEEESRKRQEETVKQLNHLMEVFKGIPQEKVQQVLDENEGDIGETTTQLLTLVQKQESERTENIKKQQILQQQKQQQQQQEEEKKKKQEEANKLNELKIQALKEKFVELSESEVVSALEKASWDIKKALAQLMDFSAIKKRRELKDLFQSFSENEIMNALEEQNFDKLRTAQALMTEREKRRLQKEVALHQQLQLQLQQQSGVSTTAATIPVQKSAPIANTETKSNLLEKSVVLGELLEAEVAANQIHFNKEEERKKKKQQEETNQMFKTNLEHIIDTQARFNQSNLPGLVPPPGPKEINSLLGNNRNKGAPVPEESANDKQPESEKLEPPVAASSSGNSDSSSSPSSSILGNETQVTVSIVPEVVDIGEKIIVNWEIASNGQSTARDWIGLFESDKPNRQYVTYQWPGKNLSKGNLTFISPPQYGEYEFRYFPNGSYQHIAMSNRFKVGPQINISAEVVKEIVKSSTGASQTHVELVVKWKQVSGNSITSNFSRAWIGLFEKSQINNKLFLSWEYASKGGSSNEIRFKAPLKSKEYEFRFFTNSYIDVAKSNSVLIEGQDSITASYENGNVVVKLHIVLDDPSFDNTWLGVYFTHEGNNHQWRRYKYLTTRADTVTFKAPTTPGDYEVRMFANKTYDMLLKSNKFIIPFPSKQ